MNRQIAEQISHFDIFQGLPVAVVEAVVHRAKAEDVQRGTMVFEQGDIPQRIYLLLAGSVRMQQSGADGSKIIQRFIVPGEVLCIIPLFNGGRYEADAITAEASRLLSWSKDDMHGLIDQYPAIAVNIIRILGQRLNEAHNRIRELSTERVDQRIAHSLLRLVKKAGAKQDGGTTISVPLRRIDLAECSGTTLHTVSRVLSGWQKDGLLQSRGRSLIIQDLSQLQSVAYDAA